MLEPSHVIVPAPNRSTGPVLENIGDSLFFEAFGALQIVFLLLGIVLHCLEQPQTRALDGLVAPKVSRRRAARTQGAPRQRRTQDGGVGMNGNIMGSGRSGRVREKRAVNTLVKTLETTLRVR